jgi:thiol-disulfide isomerase/thioredoxin
MTFVSCQRKEDLKPIKTGKEGQPIPNINILLSDSSKYVTTGPNKKGAATVLFYLSTTCPYCRMETRRIVKEINKLKNVNFFLITQAPLKQIENYKRHFGLEKFNNIKIGRDTGFAFSRYFRTPVVPFMVIYDKQNLLKESYVGPVTKSQLIGFAKL